MRSRFGSPTVGRMTGGRFRLLAGGWTRQSGLLTSIHSSDPSEPGTSKPSASKPKQPEKSQELGDDDGRG